MIKRSLLYTLALSVVSCLHSFAFEKTDLPAIVCVPDRVLVYPRASVTTLRVWLSSNDNAVSYQWYADAGKIKSEGAEAQWELSGVKPGNYHAMVKVTGPGVGAIDCSLTVAVSLPPLDLMGGGFETARSFLLPNQLEGKGYGLYSYFLLGKEPDNLSRPRIMSSIVGYLKTYDVNELEKHFKRNEINIVYLPLRDEVEQTVMQDLKKKKYTAVAEWMLTHYDYERARGFLKKLPGQHRDGGPYLVSSLMPLSKGNVTPDHLDQNFSPVPAHLAEGWISFFVNQTAQERWWEEKTVIKIMKAMRMYLGIAAEGCPLIIAEVVKYSKTMGTLPKEK